MSNTRKITRRDAIVVVGAGVGAAVIGVGCSDDTSAARDTGVAVDAKTGTDGAIVADAATSDADATIGADSTPSSCTVYSRQTAGPFYIDKALVREDVTEGKTGTPLILTIKVLAKKNSCAPLPKVPVDIWHCDAAGVYSGYPGQLGGLDTTGKTFLRGTQITDANGAVTFKTIYPGWYPGRTTHIHFKVRESASTEAVSQLYFPEATNSAIYKVAPYATRGAKDTTNTGDGTNSAGVPPLLKLTKSGAGYTATLTVTVA